MELSKQHLQSLAESYLRENPNSLRSKHAEFVPGEKTPTAGKCWPYSGSYKRYPAVFANGAVYQDKEKVVFVHSNGEKFSHPVPSRDFLPADSPQTLALLLLPGDYYATKAKRENTYFRYDFKNRKTGVTIWFGKLNEYVHGRTVAEAKREIRQKLDVLKVRKRQARGNQRRQHLRLLLCSVEITRADVRRVGACRAGIEAFCSAHNLTGDSMESRTLYKIADYGGFVRRAILEKIHQEEKLKRSKKAA